MKWIQDAADTGSLVQRANRQYCCSYFVVAGQQLPSRTFRQNACVPLILAGQVDMRSSPAIT